jgi:hypothetical protein
VACATLKSKYPKVGTAWQAVHSIERNNYNIQLHAPILAFQTSSLST